MSKGQNRKQTTKKKAARTMKEKKADKRAKKNEQMMNRGLFPQSPVDRRGE